MKTKIKKLEDATVISMDGKLDYETQERMKEDLKKIIRSVKTDSVPKKIIFNLENLEFVGSSGISVFVQALREFNASSPLRPRYCNVASEFKRIMKAFDEENLFEFYDNEDRAKKSFDQ